MPELALYTDGGVIQDGKGIYSRSTLGVTWAWILCVDNCEVKHDSGILTPAEVGMVTVTSPNAELWAAIQGIKNLPDNWKGTFLTDCAFVIGSIFLGHTTKSQPQAIRDALTFAVVGAKARGIQMEYKHLGGHPTPSDLKDGVRNSKAPCLPVSIHNKHCDDLCNQRKKLFLLSREGKEATIG